MGDATRSRNAFDSYLRKRAVTASWPLVGATQEHPDVVVVIPALAERKSLFGTLESLARNPSSELRRTLVICVVNNRSVPFADARDVEENRETLAALAESSQPGLRLAYVDASSAGRELPEKGGVGLARKIGLDWGLSLLGGEGVLLSLDADTLVEPNYLESVRAGFARDGAWAAAVPFAHRLEGTGDEVAAIVCYEIFLRYHVMGLAYAGTPFAFHSIGSAMACTAEAYVAVSGMNQRQAGEDFYFLQQLAKTGRVDTVRGTTVHPSPRPSHRVPFGTGQRVRRFLDGAQDEYLTYNPQSYAVLKAWLQHVCEHLDTNAAALRAFAGELSPELGRFLDQQAFETVWPKLQRNARDQAQLQLQFHRWFDGFKILKLIHHLRDTELPLCDTFDAVRTLLQWGGEPFQASSGMRNDINAQIRLLEFLRQRE